MAQFIRANSDFGDAFSRTFAQSLHYAQQEAERKRQEEAWKQFSSTFVPSQPMDVQQVQAPVSELPGQSGIGTQPSAPVQQPIQTQTDQVNMPSKDQYKQLEYQTGKEFAEKLKGMAGLAPQERQMAMRQLYADREKVLSDARYEKYSTGLEELMTGYNPNDPVSAYKTKAQAVKLARQMKIDPGDALKLFEEPKQNLQFAPDGTMFVNGRQASNQGQYRAPEKPNNTVQWGPVQYDPQGRAYQVSNRNEIRPLTNYDKPTKDTRLTELEKEEKREMDYLEKSAKPGQFATPDQLKAYQGQVKALQQKYQGLREGLKQPATTPQGEKPPMTMDMVLEAITKQGEEATRKKLASVYGEEEAERWVGRARNYR